MSENTQKHDQIADLKERWNNEAAQLLIDYNRKNAELAYRFEAQIAALGAGTQDVGSDPANVNIELRAMGLRRAKSDEDGWYVDTVSAGKMWVTDIISAEHAAALEGSAPKPRLTDAQWTALEHVDETGPTYHLFCSETDLTFLVTSGYVMNISEGKALYNITANGADALAAHKAVRS